MVGISPRIIDTLPLANKLYRRAAILEWTAVGYFGCIMILIVLAAVVFLKASSVTQNDISAKSSQGHSIEQQQSDLYGSLPQLTSDIQALKGKVSSELVPIIGTIGNNPPSPALGIPIASCCKSKDNAAATFNEIADELQTTLNSATVLPDGSICISFQPGYNISVVSSHPRDQWVSIITGIRQLRFPLSPTEMSRLHDLTGKLTEAYATIDRNAPFVQELGRRETEAAVARKLGDPASEVSSNRDDIIRLIQTSITRFGTLAVIVFLIGILSGLHRYALQLVGFYNARADAMFLVGSCSQPEIIDLAGMLTPAISFGKSPQTPTEQLAQIADAISRIRGGEAKD